MTRSPWYSAVGVAMLALAWVVQAHAQEQVIALKVQSGGIGGGRDTRVFSVPLTCADQEADFIWGCGGFSVVSETFATKAALNVKPDPDLGGFLDAAGKPVFVGAAETEIRFGERKFKESVKVMRDAYSEKGVGGTIGYNIARRFQWQVTPDAKKPTLTLRPPKSPPPSEPIATLPIRDEDENLWINVKVRGSAVDLVLMPQSSDMQAGPDLQKKWDIASGKADDIKFLGGRVRTVMLIGKDAVDLPSGKETNVMVILVGDPKGGDDSQGGIRNGIGASLLNRYTYCVDPERRELMLLAKMKGAPATAPVPVPVPVAPKGK